jgi:serine/threonine protein kinase
MEYCEFDLEHIIRDKSILLRMHHVKCYMQMLLMSIQQCHKNFILHRGILQSDLRWLIIILPNFLKNLDLKPANILFNSKGILKLYKHHLVDFKKSFSRFRSDFGLARSFGSPVKMTNTIVTRYSSLCIYNCFVSWIHLPCCNSLFTDKDFVMTKYEKSIIIECVVDP